jgi:hypothetical protein
MSPASKDLSGRIRPTTKPQLPTFASPKKAAKLRRELAQPGIPILTTTLSIASQRSCPLDTIPEAAHETPGHSEPLESPACLPNPQPDAHISEDATIIHEDPDPAMNANSVHTSRRTSAECMNDGLQSGWLPAEAVQASPDTTYPVPKPHPSHSTCHNGLSSSDTAPECKHDSETDDARKAGNRPAATSATMHDRELAQLGEEVAFNPLLQACHSTEQADVRTGVHPETEPLRPVGAQLQLNPLAEAAFVTSMRTSLLETKGWIQPCDGQDGSFDASVIAVTDARCSAAGMSNGGDRPAAASLDTFVPPHTTSGTQSSPITATLHQPSTAAATPAGGADTRTNDPVAPEESAPGAPHPDPADGTMPINVASFRQMHDAPASLRLSSPAASSRGQTESDKSEGSSGGAVHLAGCAGGVEMRAPLGESASRGVEGCECDEQLPRDTMVTVAPRSRDGVVGDVAGGAARVVLPDHEEEEPEEAEGVARVGTLVARYDSLHTSSTFGGASQQTVLTALADGVAAHPRPLGLENGLSPDLLRGSNPSEGRRSSEQWPRLSLFDTLTVPTDFDLGRSSPAARSTRTASFYLEGTGSGPPEGEGPEDGEEELGEFGAISRTTLHGNPSFFGSEKSWSAPISVPSSGAGGEIDTVVMESGDTKGASCPTPSASAVEGGEKRGHEVTGALRSISNSLASMLLLSHQQHGHTREPGLSLIESLTLPDDPTNLSHFVQATSAALGSGKQLEGYAWSSERGSGDVDGDGGMPVHRIMTARTTMHRNSAFFGSEPAEEGADDLFAATILAATKVENSRVNTATSLMHAQTAAVLQKGEEGVLSGELYGIQTKAGSVRKRTLSACESGTARPAGLSLFDSLTMPRNVQLTADVLALVAEQNAAADADGNMAGGAAEADPAVADDGAQREAAEGAFQSANGSQDGSTFGREKAATTVHGNLMFFGLGSSSSGSGKTVHPFTCTIKRRCSCKSAVDMITMASQAASLAGLLSHSGSSKSGSRAASCVLPAASDAVCGRQSNAGTSPGLLQELQANKVQVLTALTDLRAALCREASRASSRSPSARSTAGQEDRLASEGDRQVLVSRLAEYSDELHDLMLHNAERTVGELEPASAALRGESDGESVTGVSAGASLTAPRDGSMYEGMQTTAAQAFGMSRELNLLYDSTAQVGPSLMRLPCQMMMRQNDLFQMMHLPGGTLAARARGEQGWKSMQAASDALKYDSDNLTSSKATTYGGSNGRDFTGQAHTVLPAVVSPHAAEVAVYNLFSEDTVPTADLVHKVPCAAQGATAGSPRIGAGWSAQPGTKSLENSSDVDEGKNMLGRQMQLLSGEDVDGLRGLSSRKSAMAFFSSGAGSHDHLDVGVGSRCADIESEELRHSARPPSSRRSTPESRVVGAHC